MLNVLKVKLLEGNVGIKYMIFCFSYYFSSLLKSFFMILALLCSLMCISCKIKSGCDMCLRKRFGCYRGCGQEDYWYESLDYRVPVSVPAQCSNTEPIPQPCSHLLVSESASGRR